MVEPSQKRFKGSKMRSNKLTLTITLLIASYAILAPLEAWIDHIFDFHFDRKDAGLQFDYEKHEGKSDVERHAEEMIDRWSSSRDRDSDRGTMLEGPDRDK